MKHVILVADDDFDNRTIAQEVLETAGYDVCVATNGEETWEKINSHQPEVVLLDLSMPKLNGWDIARRVRQHAELNDVVLIAFTAHALVGEELKAKAAGCNDYLAKPCLPKDILNFVAKWIRVRHP